MKTIKRNSNRYFNALVIIFCLVLSGFTNVYAQDNKNNNGVPIDEPPLPPDSVRIFDYVQVHPQFKSGDIHKYFNDNTITFPQGTTGKKAQGTVWVNFVVEKDGSVSTTTVIRSSDTALNNEAIKIVSASKWKPGEQNGTPVKVRVLKPVNFKIQIAPVADSTMKK